MSHLGKAAAKILMKEWVPEEREWEKALKARISEDSRK
jgi:hypothetical protein